MLDIFFASIVYILYMYSLSLVLDCMHALIHKPNASIHTENFQLLSVIILLLMQTGSTSYSFYPADTLQSWIKMVNLAVLSVDPPLVLMWVLRMSLCSWRKEEHQHSMKTTILYHMITSSSPIILWCMQVNA